MEDTIKLTFGRVIGLHQNIVNQRLDKLHIDNPEIPKSYINKLMEK